MFDSFSASRSVVDDAVVGVCTSPLPLSKWDGEIPPSRRDSARVGPRMRIADDLRRRAAREAAEKQYQLAVQEGRSIDLSLYLSAWGEFGSVAASDVFACLKKQQDEFSEWLAGSGGVMERSAARMLAECRRCHVAHFCRIGGVSVGAKHRPFASCKSPFCPTCEQARHRRMHQNICSYVGDRFAGGFFTYLTAGARRQANILVVTVRHVDSVRIGGLSRSIDDLRHVFGCVRRCCGWVEHETGWAAALHVKCVRVEDGEPVFLPHFHCVIEFDSACVTEESVRRMFAGRGVEVHVARIESAEGLAKVASYIVRSAVRQGVRGDAGMEPRRPRAATELVSFERWAGLVRGFSEIQGVRRFLAGGSLRFLFSGFKPEDEEVLESTKRVYERRGEKSVVPLHSVFAWNAGYGRWVRVEQKERCSVKSEAVKLVERSRAYIDRVLGLQLGNKSAEGWWPRFGAGWLLSFFVPMSYEWARSIVQARRARHDWEVCCGCLRSVVAAGRPPSLDAFDSVRFSEWVGLSEYLRCAWEGPYEYWRGRVDRARRRLERAERSIARLLIADVRRYFGGRSVSFSYSSGGFAQKWRGGSFNSSW